MGRTRLDWTATGLKNIGFIEGKNKIGYNLQKTKGKSKINLELLRVSDIMST